MQHSPKAKLGFQIMMKIGAIGGTGMLGKAIVTAWLDTGTVTPDNLVLLNRSGTSDLVVRWPGLRVTRDLGDLGDCDALLLVVPPDQARKLDLDAADKLILSVMAGVTIDQLAVITGSPRIVRAMSSPAAELHMAFSPWTTNDDLSDQDLQTVTALFTACGATARIDNEDHIDRFTAMTGPVPGFVAAFAEAMIDHAMSHGIPTETADTAIRQLFLSAGTMMAKGKSPGDHVTEMIDYAGTTAAGLIALRDNGLADAVDAGLEAAYARTKTI